jgi:hypothetical protein
MLTAAATPVKLRLEATPEQHGCSVAIEQALTIFWTLVERLQAAAAEEQPIHQVGETIFRDVLKIGLAMLRAFLASSGRPASSPSAAQTPLRADLLLGNRRSVVVPLGNR